MTDIAATIRNRRRELGFSQAYVADESAVPQPEISRLENGVNTNLELNTLRRIATTLRLEIRLVPDEPESLHTGCPVCGALTLDGADFCPAHTPQPVATSAA